MNNILRILKDAATHVAGQVTQALEANQSLTAEGQSVIHQTKKTWEANKPKITSMFEKFQTLAALNVAFTILYAFYSKKFNFYGLASIYASIELSRACSTLKKSLVSNQAFYLEVNTESLTNANDKNQVTRQQNAILAALKADLIRNSWIMSLMNP